MGIAAFYLAGLACNFKINFLTMHGKLRRVHALQLQDPIAELVCLCHVQVVLEDKRAFGIEKNGHCQFN